MDTVISNSNVTLNDASLSSSSPDVNELLSTLEDSEDYNEISCSFSTLASSEDYNETSSLSSSNSDNMYVNTTIIDIKKIDELKKLEASLIEMLRKLKMGDHEFIKFLKAKKKLLTEVIESKMLPCMAVQQFLL